jgi:acetylornithine/LysW-gamma-L-lysine aminotransferase
MNDFIKLEQTFGLDIFPKRDVVIVRGENATVWDSEGKAYIDCVGGHGAVNIGHCNAEVVKAVSDQMKKLISCPGIFYNDIRAQLMVKLIAIAPGRLSQAFLCNSGTEAVEAAIKFARYTTGKTGFICAMRSYHGRTMGALSATYNPKYREKFQPLVPGFEFVPFNNFAKLASAAGPDTAAVILEPVQGEGGVNIGDRSYFEAVQALCRDHGILLIIDEVQTGFCRTGRMFASEHFDLEPDILCVAKSIAGGLPMGATLVSEQIKIEPGQHGTTFGGNPVTCAAAIAAIDYMITHDLAKQAQEKGDYLAAKLISVRHAKVREIRNLGLMFGIELKEKVQPYIIRLLEMGVLVLPAGPTVLRLLPPVTIPYSDLDEVAGKIHNVMTS